MMTDEEFIEFTEETIKNFSGQFDTLYSALGALLVGRYFGWRVLKLTLSPTTYSKYKKVLGIDYKDELEPLGFYSHKSLGLKLANKIGNFWDIVQGRSNQKIGNKEKRKIINDTP